MRNTSYRYWMIYVIAIVAAMGGLLFGFDTGVISGAIPFFQKDFGIDDSMVEVVTSSGLLGAILGSMESASAATRESSVTAACVL